VGGEHDSYYASYNSKGRCKAYESGGGEYKFAYNGEGLVTSRKYYSSFGVEVPGGKPNNTRKFTRNKKGDVTKYKVTNFIDDKFYTDTTTIKNKYKSGRLASWTKTPNSSQVNMDEKVTGKFTWKKISVPKKLAAKVKAQQRWIIDSTMTDVDSNQMALPLVVINK